MFLYHKWLELPITTRIKIASVFGIEKKGPTEVFNNTIKNDGFILKDIESKLNIGALQDYLQTTETELAKLWEMLVDKAEGRYKFVEVPVVEAPIIEAVPVVETPVQVVEEVVEIKTKKTKKNETELK